MTLEATKQKVPLQKQNIESECDINYYQIVNRSGLVINLGWIATEYVHPLLHGTQEEEEKTNQNKIKEDYIELKQLNLFFLDLLSIAMVQLENSLVISRPTINSEGLQI